MSTNTHKQICENFLTFYKGKGKKQKSEALIQIDMQKELRLLEDMFDKEELASAIDGLRDAVVESVEIDLTECTSLTLHVIKQLYLQAEGFGETLDVSISALDDGEKLNMIARLADKQEEAVQTKDHGGSSAGDALVAMKINDQSDVNASVGRRLEQLTSQNKSANTENTQLTNELAKLKSQLKETNTGLTDAGNEGETQDKLAKRRSKLISLKDKNENKEKILQTDVLGLQNELSKKVTEVKQYTQLKGMIEKKNKTIRELKEKITTKGASPEAE